MKKYLITGLADKCQLSIDQDPKRGGCKEPFFKVESDGAFSGGCCYLHVAALIKAEEQTKTAVAAPVPQAQPAPRPAVAAAMGNAK